MIKMQQVLDILGLKHMNQTWDPKEMKDIDAARAKLLEIIPDEEAVENITSYAITGILSYLQYESYMWE